MPELPASAIDQALQKVRSIWSLMLGLALVLCAAPLLGPPDAPWLTPPSLWQWDWGVLVPLAAALALPAAFHRWQRRRAGSAAVIELRLGAAGAVASYRQSRPALLVLHRTALRRRAEAYMDRLCLALALIAPAALSLLGQSFLRTPDLTAAAIRSPAEQLALCLLLLCVVLYHRPTCQRVIGPPLSKRERSLAGAIES